MTVRELIAQLGDYPPDMQVHYDYDSGYGTISVERISVSGQGFHGKDLPQVVLLD